LGWEILLVVIPGSFAYAGYCFKQSLDIVSTGHTWLSAYRHLQGTRQADALSGLLRDVLKPFVSDYLQLTVPDDQPPLSDAELTATTRKIRQEVDPRGKAYLFRELLTKPIASSVVDGVKAQLAELAPTATASGEVQKALMEIEVPSQANVERIQLRFRRLRALLMVQAGLAAALGLLLVVTGVFRQAGWLTASGAVLVPMVGIAAFAHMEHWRLRGKLVPDRRPEELMGD
jgi:hypothetical protein